MLKRFVGTRAISIMDIPGYMNEFDELEDVYFGNKKIENKMELAKLKGLYEYLWWLKTPEKPSVHVPYNVLAYVAKVAPKGSETEYIMQKLREYSYIKGKEGLTPDLKERIQYALNWAQDFTEIKETTIQLNDQEKAAISDLILGLQSDPKADAERIQGIVFETARKNNVAPSRFFKVLYNILLDASAGPRMGPYIISMGKDNVIQALERATKKT
jgi:lysyl-tRNA synthetase class 1